MVHHTVCDNYNYLLQIFTAGETAYNTNGDCDDVGSTTSKTGLED